MDMPNYKMALDHLLENEVDEDLICEIGLNRKSRQYDKPYFKLYQALHRVFVLNDMDNLISVYDATRDIKIGKWWRNYLFDTTSEKAISNYPVAHLKTTLFNEVEDENTFKIAFFKIMHLFKSKATLSDYLDLNRRMYCRNAIEKCHQQFQLFQLVRCTMAISMYIHQALNNQICPTNESIP